MIILLALAALVGTAVKLFWHPKSKTPARKS